MTKIIGIDPSLSSTGWAVVEKNNQSFRYISSGTIKTKSSDEIVNRIFTIKQSLDAVLALYIVDCAIVEDCFVSINQASSLKLAISKGSILSSLCDFFIKLHPINTDKSMIDLSTIIKNVSPTFVKKAITGSGKADKIQIDKMIRMIVTGIPDGVFKNNDESDAIAIAICIA